MKHLGIEIEFTGITREQVCKALCNLFETDAVIEEISPDDLPYKRYKVKDYNGFEWIIMRDRSIKPLGGYEYEQCCELTSPVLNAKTLPILFTVIDVIKALGGVVNDSCGIHIHVDAPKHVDEAVVLLKKFMYSRDEVIKYFGIEDYRLKKYCKMYDGFEIGDSYRGIEDLLEDVKNQCLDADKAIRDTRYFGLNLYSIIDHHTVEFRMFNSSLDRIKIIEYIDWVLHFCYNVNDFSDYIQSFGKILYSYA